VDEETVFKIASCGRELASPPRVIYRAYLNAGLARPNLGVEEVCACSSSQDT
jgi:hypothetical protein